MWLDYITIISPWILTEMYVEYIYSGRWKGKEGLDSNSPHTSFLYQGFSLYTGSTGPTILVIPSVMVP